MPDADARDANPEQPPTSPYVRLPAPLVAAVLFAFLAALLAFGLYANANLRPQGTRLPTPQAAVPATQATPTPPATTPTARAASPTPRPTPPPPTPPAAAAQPTLTPQPVVQATPPAEPPSAPTPLPTVDPAQAAEIGHAYEHFWQVTAQALLDLDTVHLPEVMDGDYLQTVSQRIDELRSENRAIKTDVSLNYTVTEVTADTASVIDDYEDNSIYVEIGTENPLTDPVNDHVTVLYSLRNISGTWKVVDSVRSE